MLTALAAPGATLLMFAAMAGSRILVPRGIDEAEIVALLGPGWQLEHGQSVATGRLAAPARRAHPTLYRLTRRDDATGPLTHDGE